MALVFLLAGCAETVVAPWPDVEGLILMPADPGPLCAGVELKIHAVIRVPTGEQVWGWPVTWNSSNPSVAKIDAVRSWNGEVLPSEVMVTAAAEGEAVITASTGPDSAAVRISVRPAPCMLLAVAGDSQVGVVGAALPESLVVRLVDGRGDPMGRSIVAWYTLDGSVKPDSSVTDSAGEARAQWTLDYTIGRRSASVRAAMSADFYASPFAWRGFTAMAVAQPPSTLRFTVQPAGGEARAVLAPVEVAANDGWGNPDPSFVGQVTIAIHDNSSGGTLGGTTTVLTQNGLARFTDLSIDKPGMGYTFTVSAGGRRNSTSSRFTVSPAGAAVDQQQTALWGSEWQIDAGAPGDRNDAKVAQVVTAGLTGVLGEVDLAVGCVDNDLVLEIRRVADGVPTEEVLTSQLLAGELLSDRYIALRRLILSAPLQLSAGDQFAIVARVRYANSLQGGGCFVRYGPSGDPYPRGKAYYSPGRSSGWVPAFENGNDFAFRTLVVP